MKPATGIGIGCAIVGILMGAMMDGTSPAAFMNPGAPDHHPRHRRRDVASVGMDAMKKIPPLYKRVSTPSRPTSRAA